MTLSTPFSHRARLVGALGCLFTLTAVCGPALADPTTPTVIHRSTASAVATLMANRHLTQHPLDDEISQRCLKTFLEGLDPWKLYLLQTDVDQFMKRQNELDDLAKDDPKAFLNFAVSVFRQLLERMDQRAPLVEELLKAEHDFTVDEEIVRDPDLLSYAKNEAEIRERWRKLIKFEFLTLKADEIEDDKAIEKLQRRYRSRFRRMHQTDNEELFEIYLTALTTAFDPHSSYMSPKTVENFLIIMRLGLQGIGAALQWVDGETVVKRVIAGGAAEEDGRLKVEDRVVGVGQGKEGEIEDVVDMKLSDVVAKIRGKAGTWVRLAVSSPDSPERRIIDIKRAKIELKESEAEGEIFSDVGQNPDGTPYKIGVINLPSFYLDMEAARKHLSGYRSTTRDVRKILDEFNEQKVDAVVLDLRKNGGGSLQEAIQVTGLFIKEGPVVQVKTPNGSVQAYRDLDRGVAWKGPLVVLISKLSASASEILAGAIQDYGRGLIVGDRATHGKGTVQSLTDLAQEIFRGIPNPSKDYGSLKYTIQQFYRPNGDSTQRRGVLSDVELPSRTTHAEVGEADLDYPIAFDQVEPASFDKLSMVDEAIRHRLSDLSSQRRKESEGFQKVLEKIKRDQELREKKTVTLNEAKFMAEIERRKAEREEKDAIQHPLEHLGDPSENGIERDYYLDEALAITVDYLKLVMVAQSN
ncbi:MAG: carboxy terminal-processing peptidase [Planctomycetota bacterium]|jgi:carboxyl-terminal processing protease